LQRDRPPLRPLAVRKKAVMTSNMFLFLVGSLCALAVLSCVFGAAHSEYRAWKSRRTPVNSGPDDNLVAAVEGYRQTALKHKRELIEVRKRQMHLLMQNAQLQATILQLSSVVKPDTDELSVPHAPVYHA